MTRPVVRPLLSTLALALTVSLAIPSSSAEGESATSATAPTAAVSSRPPLPSGPPLPDWKQYAREQLGFSKGDLARIDREVVAMEIPGESSKDVLSVFAAVRVPVPMASALERLQAEGGRFPNSVVRQRGQFGEPPSAADAASLRVPDSDIQALRSCRPGACKVKLSAAQIEEVAAMDWSDRNAGAKATDWLRQQLGETAAIYRRDGAAGLPPYSDKPAPARVDAAVGALVDHARFLFQAAPDIHRHLREGSTPPPDGTRERLSWSLNDFGLRPVLFVTHSFFFPQSEPRPFALIADKHVYASHYFLARVELTGLLEDDRGDGDTGFYVVYADRSLFDDSPGMVKRKLLVRDVLQHVRARLGAIRSELASAGSETERAGS